MPRGSEAKSIVTKKILETFEDAFVYDKEIRIPVVENGETIQIKCVLTAAKVNVSMGSDVAVPASAPTSAGGGEITEQEKAQVDDLMRKLNL